MTHRERTGPIVRTHTEASRRHEGRPTESRGGRAGRRDEPLPVEVRALVTRAFVTPAHLDALLALRGAAPGSCTLEALAVAARLPLGAVARRCVDELVGAGLVAWSAELDAYRYAPASDALETSVESLAAAYGARPGRVLRAVYAGTPVVRGGDRHDVGVRARPPQRMTG